MSIDNLTRRFAEAGSELAIALTKQLEESDPDLTAKIAQAISSGERLCVCLEFALETSCVRLETVDDYEARKRVLTIAAQVPRSH